MKIIGYCFFFCWQMFFLAEYAFCALPDSIALDDRIYMRVAQEVTGNHKYARYVPTAETGNNWTSSITIHQFLTSQSPMELAEERGKSPSSIEYINEDKNQVLQTFNTMNTINDGDTVIYEQNVCRYKKYSYGKGIMGIQYAVRSVTPNNANVGSLSEINPIIIGEIKALPIDKYQF